MNITTLANEMNVTENDIVSLLNMVLSSIEQDGMREIFISMSKEERTETAKAYFMAEVKKFSEFCVSLLTNDEKRSAFEQYMISRLA